MKWSWTQALQLLVSRPPFVIVEKKNLLWSVYLTRQYKKTGMNAGNMGVGETEFMAGFGFNTGMELMNGTNGMLAWE